MSNTISVYFCLFFVINFMFKNKTFYCFENNTFRFKSIKPSSTRYYTRLFYVKFVFSKIKIRFYTAQSQYNTEVSIVYMNRENV